jgi:hypothetical protein
MNDDSGNLDGLHVSKKSGENSITSIDIWIDSIVFEGLEETTTNCEKLVAIIQDALPSLIMKHDLELGSLFKGIQKRESFLGNDVRNKDDTHVDISEIDAGAIEFANGVVNGVNELANGTSDLIVRGLLKTELLRDVASNAQDSQNSNSSNLQY